MSMYVDLPRNFGWLNPKKGLPLAFDIPRLSTISYTVGSLPLKVVMVWPSVESRQVGSFMAESIKRK
ncbi:hypothetical protein DSO57_1024501 [Entomophthora muscae]|uniref:Uncharacterized protein n=1 Tax=Entomophthora muscae TaxID=34485 RepID=A0ACC2T2N1_9FUNG|nr:hypothetical protein DSO57_1024501 [Entomophthora muscae]